MPHLNFFEIEGRPVIAGYIAGKGAWGAVWRDGTWRTAPGLARKEGRQLSRADFELEFPDLDASSADDFSNRVPATAFDDRVSNSMEADRQKTAMASAFERQAVLASNAAEKDYKSELAAVLRTQANS